jgi:spore maturation protein SpmA
MGKASGSTKLKDGETDADVTNGSGSTAFPGTKTIKVTCSESGTVTARGSDDNIATVAVNGSVITLTPVKVGSIRVTVGCGATTNYNASSAVYDWEVTK